MTEDTLLDELLVREGGYREEKKRENAPPDPETNRGITYPTYTNYCHRTGRAVSRQEFLQMPDDLAKAIYTLLFVEDPGFTAANIPYEPLRVQMIDFGVNSGPPRAIRWLQRVCGLQATGNLNAQTLAFLGQEQWNGFERPLLAIVNDALVAARSYMVDQAVDQGLMRKADEEGVESRALSFFLARP